MSKKEGQNKMPPKGNKNQRTIAEKSYRYHHYFKRTGRYKFVFSNLFKVVAVIAAFGVGAWIVTTFIIDLDSLMALLFDALPTWLIVTILFASESVFGFLPPDLFIFWAKTLPNPYVMVFILALASYGGGVVSYIIGRKLYKVPKIQQWVSIKFEEQFKIFKKFGGLLIFISALTPLPFSWVSIVSGVVKYPFKTFLIIALSRIVRFFGYAYVFFQIV